MMKEQFDYVDRFMMHAELYMLLSGKAAGDLTADDMDKIEQHINLLKLQDNCEKQPTTSMQPE